MGEHLYTGWEPDASPGDTLLMAYVANWADCLAHNASTFGGEILRRDHALFTNVGRPSAFGNSLLLRQPLTPALAPLLMAEADTFFADGTGDVYLFSPWPTPDLSHRGWSLIGHPPLHFRPPGIPGSRPLPEGLTIDKVTSDDALDQWESVVINGFPFEDLDCTDPGCLIDDVHLNDPRLHLWLGCLDAEPVAASAAFVNHGLVNVTMVATLPAARRRGIGEALTWAATLADPALPAMLLSSDDGRPIYDRMGFYPLLRWTLWYRPRL